MSQNDARRIEFIRLLGKGGFGAVYLADVHGRDGFVQRLAVKVLNERMSGVPDLVARQRDEAHLLAQLNHDHIVKVMDLTEVGDRPAVIMEYVEGVDVDYLLRRGAIPPRAVLQVATAAATALHAAYTTVSPRTGQPLRVVHRDIKPSNLLITPHGGVKVLDFGVAKADFDREGQTQSAQFGTPRFMAPEQWLQNRSSPAVDVFALGLCVVEMMLGNGNQRLPLQRDLFDHRIAEMTQAIQKLEGPRAWRRDLASTLTQILSFNDADRPEAGAVADAFAQLADRAGGLSLRQYAKDVVPSLALERSERLSTEPVLDAVTTSRNLADRTTEPQQDPSLVVEHVPAQRRGRAPMVGALLLTGGVLLTAGYLSTSQFSSPDTERHETSPMPDPSTIKAKPEPAPAPMPVVDVAIEERPPIEAPIQQPPRLKPRRTPKASQQPAPETVSTPKPEQVLAAPETETVETQPAEPEATEPEATEPEATEPETAPTPEPVVETLEVRVTSVPMGAKIFVDGKAIGRSTPARVSLPKGPHQVHLAFEGGTETEGYDIIIDPRGATAFHYAQNAWTSRR